MLLKMTSECEKAWAARQVPAPTLTPLGRADTMLLSLPLEIWEIIFDLLPGQDLHLLSKVESITSSPDVP